MLLTPEELEQAKTPKGGYTRAQLEAWGVPWPPPKGWRKALLGKAKKESTRPLVPADPQGHRDDGSPVAGEGQVYVTRKGKAFHPRWCSIMAAHWRDNHSGIYGTTMADVGSRRCCTQCEIDSEEVGQSRSPRVEWRRLNDELNSQARGIAERLLAEGPSAVQRLGPQMDRYGATKAEFEKVSESLREPKP